MDIRRRVGQNVRHFRRQRGWSQEDLAFESELHRTYISGIERGIRNPTITIVEQLAATLGVTPGTLLDQSSAASARGRRRSKR